MVSLAAAAVVEDLLAAVGVADVFEALGDLGDRGVPVDLLVAAVGASPHRGRQPAAVVLVVIEPQRLVARVALRRRMLLVTADLGQRAALELHDDATVALAQDAGGRLPLTGHQDFLSARLGLQQGAQLTLDEVEWFHVAGCPGDDDRALDRSRHQHRQFLRTRGGRHLRPPVVWPIRSVQSANAAAARSMTFVVRSGLSGSPASTVTATIGQPAR